MMFIGASHLFNINSGEVFQINDFSIVIIKVFLRIYTTYLPFIIKDMEHILTFSK